jgi:hypothetical protein
MKLNMLWDGPRHVLVVSWITAFWSMNWQFMKGSFSYLTDRQSQTNKILKQQDQD